MRTPIRLRGALALAALLGAALAPLDAQDSQVSLTAYAPTLTFGTGLINTPAAWVSPANGDIWLAVSARGLNAGSLSPRPNGSLWDITTALEAHFLGRVGVGASMYSSSNQQVGVHASLLLHRQQADLRWLPSVAVGVRNLGASAYQDRFVSGSRRVIDVVPINERAGRGVIDGNPTFYGVATREFTGEKMSLGISAGYGTGLFKNDGGLDTVYNKAGTLASGVFGGARLSIRLSPKSMLELLIENDGWDWNLGGKLSIGHLLIGLMASEIEEAKGLPAGAPLANWTKTNLLVGYNGSIPDIVRGSRQRSEAVELELEARRLRREVAQRQMRMTELQQQLAKADLKASAESAAQRAALEKALESEREAAKRATERLQKVKPGTKPPEEN